MSTAERILFVDLWRLGDTVAATAGLRALRAVRPDAEIAVLAHPQYGDPLFRSRAADHRIPFAAFWTRGKTAADKYLPWTIAPRPLVDTARAIRAFRPDACLLFRGDPREATYLTGIGVRNISDIRRGALTVPGVRYVTVTERVPRYREYVLHVGRWSGRAVDAMPALEGIPDLASDGGRRGIVIHPGASWRYKQWRRASVSELARRLGERDIPVVLVGTAEDRPFIDSVLSEQPAGATITAAYPTLEGLYALCASAAAVVCNNSAALHIAEAVDTPCVAITGSSDPVRWGTYRPHSRTICRGVGLACHPCKERRCVRPSHPCVDDVSVDDVVEALAAIGLLDDASFSMAMRQVSS